MRKNLVVTALLLLSVVGSYLDYVAHLAKDDSEEVRARVGNEKL